MNLPESNDDNEAATRKDVEDARDRVLGRLDAMDRNFEGLRSQNSAEHGALEAIAKATRSMMAWMQDKWLKFTRPS